jgi:proprotein convertase subtilisin/kexin type 5
VACGTCTSPVNSAVTCSSCRVAGFIRTSLLTACFSCFSGCYTCTSTAANACLSCSYGYFLDSVAHTCGQTCPSGYYSTEIGALCSICNPPCANCIGINGGSYYCQSCIANYYLYNFACATSCPNSLLGYQGNCIASCPAGTYADGGTITCMTCTTNCQ